MSRSKIRLATCAVTLRHVWDLGIEDAAAITGLSRDEVADIELARGGTDLARRYVRRLSVAATRRWEHEMMQRLPGGTSEMEALIEAWCRSTRREVSGG